MMENTEFKFDWVCCDGGPLLVVEEKYLASWEGAAAPSNGRVVEANFRWGLEVATDYDRACDVEDLISLINVGEGKAIVLGTDENLTVWLPLIENQEGMLIRWVYANSEDEAINTARFLSNKSGKDEGIEFAVGDSDLVLFAACEEGNIPIYSRLKFNLSKGVYRISTIDCEDKWTSVICHHFRKVI